MDINKKCIWYIKYKNTYRQINNIPKNVNELFDLEEIYKMEIEKTEGNKVYIKNY